MRYRLGWGWSKSALKSSKGPPGPHHACLSFCHLAPKSPGPGLPTRPVRPAGCGDGDAAGPLAPSRPARAGCPHLSTRGGGLGRPHDPRQPRPGDLSTKLPDCPCHRDGRGPDRGHRGPGLSEDAGKGARGSASLHVAGRGAAHVRSPRCRAPGTGLPLCLNPGGGPRRGRTRASGAAAAASPARPGPPLARSPGLRAAASRAQRPRLGSARRGLLGVAARSSPRPGRAGRGRRSRPACARARRCLGLRADWPRPLESCAGRAPAAGPRAGSGGEGRGGGERSEGKPSAEPAGGAAGARRGQPGARARGAATLPPPAARTCPGRPSEAEAPRASGVRSQRSLCSAKRPDRRAAAKCQEVSPARGETQGPALRPGTRPGRRMRPGFRGPPIGEAPFRGRLSPPVLPGRP